MPELASRQTTIPPGNCPSAEELAAYIDGMLPPEEAARVAEHLASCESCFEIYSDVLRFKLEEESEGEAAAAEQGKVVRFPATQKGRGVPWWASVAALLAVGLGAGFGAYSYLLAPPPDLSAARFATPRLSPAALQESLWRGATYRGGSDDDSELPCRQAAFRAGVQIVNLQVSLTNNDREAVQGFIIPALLGALQNQVGVKELQDGYSGISTSFSSAKPPEPKELLPEAARLARESRQFFEPLYVDLGQWAAAGHLAAKAQDPAFFRQPENRAFLRHVLWRDRLGFKESKLPAASRKDFYEIGQILDKSDLQSSDYEKLAGLFDKILEANYPD